MMKLIKIRKAKEALEGLEDYNEMVKSLEDDILQTKIKETIKMLDEEFGGGYTDNATQLTGVSSEWNTIIFGDPEVTFVLGLKVDEELNDLILRKVDKFNYEFVGRYTVLSYLKVHSLEDMKKKLR